MRVLLIGGTVFIGRAIAVELVGAGHDLCFVHRGDHGMTGTIAQDLLVDSTKARELLGWTDTDPREALRASVGWHLANPPEESDENFSADDEALAAV